ncbi:hypothetical protein R6Q59_026424 [Mikania micrantha]
MLYVMKGITLAVMQMSDIHDGNDCFTNEEDGFVYNMKAAYSGAMSEIFDNHKDKMKMPKTSNLLLISYEIECFLLLQYRLLLKVNVDVCPYKHLFLVNAVKANFQALGISWL